MGLLSYHEFWPQGSCPGAGLKVKIKDTVKMCFLQMCFLQTCFGIDLPIQHKLIQGPHIGHEVKSAYMTFFIVQLFALYLEDCLMYKHDSLG